MKKILRAAALTLCLLFLAGAGVTAAEGGTDAADPAVPTAVFTNRENTTPDLNVVKYVESLDAAYPAPQDAEFTFVVKVDGELYKYGEYELYRADEPGKAPELYRTTRNGSFTLKAGERARFVYLGAGKHYEVYEETLPEHFVQLIPAEGTSVTGTIPPGGALAAFTNQYQPPAGPGPDPETTKLIVSKRISFPVGYTPPQSPAFSFRVTLDGKAYGQEPYEIYSLDTGLPLGTGVTDEKGSFPLNAGEQAVFADIPVNMDYKVEELLEEEGGWWSTGGKTSQEGATKAPAVTVNFANANASFIVTKQLEDNAKPDKEFTFTLMKEDRSPWGGAQYYLYSTKGELIAPKPTQPADAGEPLPLPETGADGTFRLKPGQAAVFVGIKPGTLYHVAETKDPQYSQLTPTSPEGYRDKVVQSTVEVLPFVNRMEEMKGVLTVTKQLTTGEIVPENPVDFTFCIRKGSPAGTAEDSKPPETAEGADTTGMTFAPMADIVYQVNNGMTTRTGRTDEDGCFTLKAGETARFETLLKGTYQVEEITKDLSPQYTIPEEERVVTKDLIIQEEAGAVFAFHNHYDVAPLSVRIVKTGWGMDTGLSGAVFRLYHDANFKGEILPEEHPQGAPFEGYITDGNGTVTIENLPEGEYYLKEVKAPAGYQLLANPLKISIVRKGDKLEATVNSLVPTQAGNGQVTVEDNTIVIRIQNSRNFTLPATGGEGIAFLLAAAAGIVLVLAVLWKKGKVKIKP